MAKHNYYCKNCDDPNACLHCKFGDCIDGTPYRSIYDNELDDLVPEIIANEISKDARGYTKAKSNTFEAYYNQMLNGTTNKEKKTAKGNTYNNRKFARISRIGKARIAGRAKLGDLEIDVYYNTYKGITSYWYYFNQIYGELQADKIKWIRKDLQTG